jgi:hypothetical protein
MCRPTSTPLRGFLLFLPAALALVTIMAADDADARRYVPSVSRHAVTGSIPRAAEPAPPPSG